jgi:drug/metabolite transporter (DMT)-like permease
MNIYVVLILQLFVAGGTHVVAKSVTADVDPVTLTFLRTVISGLGMILLLRARKLTWRVDREDVRRLILLGFLGIPLNQFPYLYGIGFTTAANGALLYATTPVLVMVLSAVLLKEQITARKVTGILLAFGGVIIVIFEKGLDFSSGYTYGNLVIFIGVIAWAFFTVLGRSLILKYGALKVTCLAMLIGTAMFFPIGMVGAIVNPIHGLSAADWVGILYLGFGTSIVGYVLWYYAIGRIDVSKVAVFANGQPVLATILAVIFLNYTITGNFVVGAVLTLAGVILTQLS